MCILQVLLLLPSQQGGYVIISVTLFVSSTLRNNSSTRFHKIQRKCSTWAKEENI